jgi:hypothetical protein
MNSWRRMGVTSVWFSICLDGKQFAFGLLRGQESFIMY